MPQPGMHGVAYYAVGNPAASQSALAKRSRGASARGLIGRQHVSGGGAPSEHAAAFAHALAWPHVRKAGRQGAGGRCGEAAINLASPHAVSHWPWRLIGSDAAPASCGSNLVRLLTGVRPRPACCLGVLYRASIVAIKMHLIGYTQPDKRHTACSHLLWRP